MASTLIGWRDELKVAKEADSSSKLRKALVHRYGGLDVVQERLQAYSNLISFACGLEDDCFSTSDPVAVAASPGRDRIFMGHSDFPGLGGFTVDAATRNEVLAVGQAITEPKLVLVNADAAYPRMEVSVAEIMGVANDEQAYGERNWDPTEWGSYIKGCLCYLLSPRFTAHKAVREALGGKGIRLLVSSQGALALPASGGVSSSASLTGAFSVVLADVLGLELSLDQLAQSDYGEYYLGKMAGAADKMAQLNARRGQVVVINSLPEKCLHRLDFPPQVVVLLADSPTPRLTTTAGRRWLASNAPPGYREEDVSAISAWATHTMKTFSSTAFVAASAMLVDCLDEVISGSNHDDYEVSVHEAVMVKEALFFGVDQRCYKGPLLRELCLGGALDAEELAGGLNHDMMGWSQRHARYNLIFRLLRILPDGASQPSHLRHLRKAALYGMSEVERGWVYLQTLRMISDAGDDSVGACERLLDLVRLSHDGDRACTDYRQLAVEGNTSSAGSAEGQSKRVFAPSQWASHVRNRHCDKTVQGWIASEAELVDCVGSFERSLPEVDEMADLLDKKFDRQAALRISAAGLGGKVCIHVRAGSVQAVVDFLVEEHGWTVRRLHPGSATQILSC